MTRTPAAFAAATSQSCQALAISRTSVSASLKSLVQPICLAKKSTKSQRGYLRYLSRFTPRSASSEAMTRCHFFLCFLPCQNTTLSLARRRYCASSMASSCSYCGLLLPSSSLPMAKTSTSSAALMNGSVNGSRPWASRRTKGMMASGAACSDACLAGLIGGFSGTGK